ncbi:MAG TPA: type II toxin-antitoxin system prevent-host-death family antitoxin [Acidimicrobiales bacterium]|jgi:prevent-host-death family protein|nr:type II toxin-antitoxin system prevent-host-death family antitoxin [Acidimicrobiales bacterium]
MTRIVTATEAKATILALLDEAADGEEVEITKHGRVVARLVPAVGPNSLKGSLASAARTAEAGDDLLNTGADWNLA